MHDLKISIQIWFAQLQRAACKTCKYVLTCYYSVDSLPVLANMANLSAFELEVMWDSPLNITKPTSHFFLSLSLWILFLREINTLYPDTNLTEISPNLFLFCLLLCKISVCPNFFFFFWLCKS